MDARPKLRIQIDGTEAARAGIDLLGYPTLEGACESPSETERADPITLIASITGIVGGAIATANTLAEWYKRWRSGSSTSPAIDRVLIVSQNGERILLEDVSVEELAEFLERANK